MTRNYFDQELQELQVSLLKMSSMVEEILGNSVKALKAQDAELAQKVIDDDDEIDIMEYVVEDKCIKLIALQSPLARDLRVIATALKIITDLERIADYAVDIAKITIKSLLDSSDALRIDKKDSGYVSHTHRRDIYFHRITHA